MCVGVYACGCVKRLCSTDAGSRAQVATENISCCHGLSGHHSEGHLEPRGSGRGWLHTLSPFVNVTRPGTGHREVGFLQSPLWLAATASATCLPVCHRTVSACCEAENRALASPSTTPLTSLLPLPGCSPRSKSSSLSFALWPSPQVLASRCVDVCDSLPDILYFNAALFETDPVMLPLPPLGLGCPKAEELYLGRRVQVSRGLEPLSLLLCVHSTQPVYLSPSLLRYEAATEPLSPG